MLTSSSKHISETSKVSIEINSDSGFCFGVVNAIKTAEEQLKSHKPLYCVGDIVHNEQEIHRLENLGLKVISQKDISDLKNQKVIFRAHGEPKSSYEKVAEGKNTLIDATCPVVLKIQKRIEKVATTTNAQIVIYGKCHHPEVIGLMDRTHNNGICIETLADLQNIDFSKNIEVFSQTTQPIDGFETIVNELQKRAKATVKINDTICRQVSCRGDKLAQFAKTKDLVFFIGGKKSSNAKVLFNICKKENSNSFFIESADDIDLKDIINYKNIGICGATSTPDWLMQNVKHYLENELNKDINRENYG